MSFYPYHSTEDLWEDSLFLEQKDGLLQQFDSTESTQSDAILPVSSDACSSLSEWSSPVSYMCWSPLVYGTFLSVLDFLPPQQHTPENILFEMGSIAKELTIHDIALQLQCTTPRHSCQNGSSWPPAAPRTPPQVPDEVLVGLKETAFGQAGPLPIGLKLDYGSVMKSLSGMNAGFESKLS